MQLVAPRQAWRFCSLATFSCAFSPPALLGSEPSAPEYQAVGVPVFLRRIRAVHAGTNLDVSRNAGDARLGRARLVARRGGLEAVLSFVHRRLRAADDPALEIGGTHDFDLEAAMQPGLELEEARWRHERRRRS